MLAITLYCRCLVVCNVVKCIRQLLSSSITSFNVIINAHYQYTDIYSQTYIFVSYAVGFRIEHPQDVINHIQYGPEFGLLPASGKGPVPVADYRLAVEVPIAEKNRGGGVYSASSRACYSFCMCPGGQIVPTSVKEDELCINGMSFSQRQSKWANSALVVNVTPEDMVPLGGDGPLRGVAWQQHHERLAAAMGGGNLTCPVQRATDYMTGTLSEPDADTGKFSSSYRLGVRSAPLHDVYVRCSWR